MEIVKFGGSSLATPDNIRQAVKIIRAHPNARVVVVSAPGKFGRHRTKVTDDLIRVTHGERLLNRVLGRFRRLGQALLTGTAASTFRAELRRTQQEIIYHQHDASFIVSRGEYLTAKLLAFILDFNFVDAADVLVINPDATVNLTATTARIKRGKLRKRAPFVIGGFYGTRDGRTALFSRGGSDYTGAVLAALLHAKIYLNYTDTHGIQTADPRRVPTARTIRCLDFDALDLLTHNGAGVIHENVAALLKQFRIPLRVDNTFAPDVRYTEVHSPHCQHAAENFFCLTAKDNTIFVVTKTAATPLHVQTLPTTAVGLNDDLNRLHASLLRTHAIKECICANPSCE